MEEKYTIEMTGAEINLTLIALKDLPYKHSAMLIDKISKSVGDQQLEREKKAKAAKVSKAEKAD